MHFRAESKLIIRVSIRGLQDFTRSNLSGKAYVNWSEVYKGRLESDDYNMSDYDREREIYVIKSYQTPIAWCFVRGDDTREWTIVNRTFSPTTQRHKAVIRESIA